MLYVVQGGIYFKHPMGWEAFWKIFWLQERGNVRLYAKSFSPDIFA